MGALWIAKGPRFLPAEQKDWSDHVRVQGGGQLKDIGFYTTFGILGQVCYLIVSIPDLCCHSYFP